MTAHDQIGRDANRRSDFSPPLLPAASWPSRRPLAGAAGCRGAAKPMKQAPRAKPRDEGRRPRPPRHKTAAKPQTAAATPTRRRRPSPAPAAASPAPQRRCRRRPSISPATMRRSRPRATTRLRAEDAGRMREAMAAIARRQAHGSQGACATRSPIRPARKLDRLVPLPRRLRHRRRGTRLPGRQSGLARPQPPHPALRGGTVQQPRPARARSRPSSPTASPRPAWASPRWPRPGRRQGRGRRQGARGEGLDRARHPRQPGAGLPQARRAAC